MTHRRGLIATGIATVLLFLAMSPAEQRMQENGTGMVPFELTGGQDRADEILAEWGSEGRDAARESLWIDFGFLLAYGAFLTIALGAVRDLAGERGWHRRSAVGRASPTPSWFAVRQVAGLAVSLGKPRAIPKDLWQFSR